MFVRSSRSKGRKLSKKAAPKQKRHYLPVLPREGGRSSVSGIVATVFGATGFLGRFVVNHLGRGGSQIVVPFRGEEMGYAHLKVMGDLGQIIPIKYDIRDKDSIRNACKHSNVIINLLGRTFDTRNFKMRDVHVGAAVTIGEVAKELGIQRVIHVSALNASNQSESDWCKTKAEGEQAMRHTFPKATIVRPSIMWGSYDEFLNSYGAACRWWPVVLVPNGDVKIQPVWVNDVAVGITNTLKTAQSVGQIYEFAGDAVYTRKQVVEWVNFCLKTFKHIHSVKPGGDLEWHLGYWLGQHRRPRFTLDGVANRVDSVATGNFLTLKDVKVTPAPLFGPIGLSSFIHLRPPSRQFDIGFGRLPEIPGIEKGVPTY